MLQDGYFLLQDISSIITLILSLSLSPAPLRSCSYPVFFLFHKPATLKHIKCCSMIIMSKSLWRNFFSAPLDSLLRWKWKELPESDSIAECVWFSYAIWKSEPLSKWCFKMFMLAITIHALFKCNLKPRCWRDPFFSMFIFSLGKVSYCSQGVVGIRDWKREIENMETKKIHFNRHRKTKLKQRNIQIPSND